MRIRIELEVPDEIADGLRNGTLERVGGVIRFADSKQVVAWLREGGNMSRNSSSGLTLLPTLLRATGMNAQTVATLTGVAHFAFPLIDVAIVAYTIYSLRRRIEDLKGEIAEIYDRLDRQFEKGRTASLRTALDLADSFLETRGLMVREGMFNEVIGRLVEAEKLLLEDITIGLKENKLREAGQLIRCVVDVDTMAARCAIDYGQDEFAISRLNKNVAELRPHVERLVRRLVRDTPALYFHESVEDDYLDRYIQIRTWLDDESDSWKSVMLEARKDFWSEKAIKALFQNKYKFLHVYKELRDQPFYVEAIPWAESLIENFLRFEGYALELESLDRPFRDENVLSEFAAERLADQEDYVLVVDVETLARLARLAA